MTTADNSEFSLKEFIRTQSSEWPSFADNLATLGKASVCGKKFPLDGYRWVVNTLTLSYRKASAKADLAAIARGERPCFLCLLARPKEQHTHSWRGYEILVNPYPLGAGHLTIPSVAHEPQRLTQGKVCDMLDLAMILHENCIFYNGPRCGASAPDHFHFQAVYKQIAHNLSATSLFRIDSLSSAGVSVSVPRPEASPFAFFALASHSVEKLSEKCMDLLALLPRMQHEEEPQINLFALADKPSDKLQMFIIPRRCHRPSIYGEGEGQLLISPASLEMAGLFVTPHADHAAMLTADIVRRIYNEVAFNHDELRNLCNLK